MAVVRFLGWGVILVHHLTLQTHHTTTVDSTAAPILRLRTAVILAVATVEALTVVVMAAGISL